MIFSDFFEKSKIALLGSFTNDPKIWGLSANDPKNWGGWNTRVNIVGSHGQAGRTDQDFIFASCSYREE